MTTPFTAPLVKFKGLDLRKLRENSDPGTARIATNVNLTIGGEFEALDGLRELMDLHPQSKGLYAIGGTLRAVIPGGQSFPLEAIGPVRVKYDQIGFGNGYFSSVMVGSTGGPTATLYGAFWPSNVVGRTLTFGSQSFTVIATSGQDVTLNAPFTGLAGLYSFVLTGSPVLPSVSVSIVNGSDIAVLSGGVWPEGLEGGSFSIVRVGFAAHVVAKLSATELRLDTSVTTGAITDSEFQVSGLALDYPLDTLIRVTATESIGANASFGVYPYLVVERWVDAADHSLGTLFEHHWITKDSPDGDLALETQVRLPFSPGASLIKMSGKLWAGDDVNGVVHFSSTANGPRDWVTANDAGFIPVITHASGDRRIRGLGVYDDKLAVIFTDAVQLWATDPQPSNITLVRVINGPGTDQPRSVVNVLGDLFYFTRGGFRSMHMQTVTGQIQEQDDIGGPIDPLTHLEIREATMALWSQARGQYLCAFGSTVYAFKYSPKSKLMGWTTWELGVQIDAMVDMGGKTYIRAGNKLYVLDPAFIGDLTFELVLNDFTAKSPTTRKRLDFMDILQRGTCTVRVFLSPLNETEYLEGPLIEGTSLQYNRIFLGAMAKTFGFRFTGKRPWILSALNLTYIKMPW